MDRLDITILTGPTASGKTSLALDIAAQRNGVVINCDAMQLYDALPILTAQPDEGERAAAPHRLYGAFQAGVDINAASWRDLAIKEIEECAHNGHHPIIVGGTGFYIKALIEGLSPIPDVDLSIRAELNKKREIMGAEAFWNEFQDADPVMAQRLRPSDAQRTVRAYEVLIATGKSLSFWQDQPLIPPPEHYNFHVIPLITDKEKLHQKIRNRIDVMLENGAMDEIKSLAQRIDEGAVAEEALIVKAHGFRPFRKVLRGEWSMEEAIGQTDKETRAYAKRQRTWVRSQYLNKDWSGLNIHIEAKEV